MSIISDLASTLLSQRPSPLGESGTELFGSSQFGGAVPTLLELSGKARLPGCSGLIAQRSRVAVGATQRG